MIVDGFTTEIHLDGEFSDAIQWQPFALDKLRQMIRSGYRGLRVLQIGDVKLRVWLDPASKLAKVWVEASGYKLVSGLVSLELPGFPIRFGVPENTDRYGSKERFGVDRLYERYLVDGVSTYPAVSLSPPLIKNFAETQKSLTESRLDLVPLAFSDRLYSMLYKIPGMFTGKMRSVVQALTGQGKECKYSFTFAKTDGIYTAADDSLWVVRVSSEAVIARKMKAVAKKPTNAEPRLPFKSTADEVLFATDLGVLPDNTDMEPENLDRLVESGVVRVLMTREDIAPAYAFSALFPECGWAFSLSGHEAQNVLLDERDDRSVFAHRFLVTFSGDSTGPVSASLTEVESGFLYGGRMTHFKYPNYARGELVSFDYWRRRSNPDPEASMSFYVFYDGDTAVPCYHTNPGTAVRTVQPSTVKTGPGAGDFIYSFSASDEQYFSSGSGSEGVSRVTDPRETINVGSPFSITSVYDEGGVVYRRTVGLRGQAALLHGDPTAYQLVQDSYNVRVERVGLTRNGTVPFYSLSIPMYDREVVYLYSATVQQALYSQGYWQYGFAFPMRGKDIRSVIGEYGQPSKYIVASVTPSDNQVFQAAFPIFGVTYDDVLYADSHAMYPINSRWTLLDPSETQGSTPSGQNDTETWSATLTVRGSSGLNQTVWSSTEDQTYSKWLTFLDEAGSGQLLYAQRDAFTGRGVLSEDFGTDYFDVGITPYQVFPPPLFRFVGLPYEPAT